MRLLTRAMQTLTLTTLTACIAATPTPVPITPSQSAVNATMNFLVGDWNCREIVRGRVRPSRPPFDIYRTTTYIMEIRYTFDAAKAKWVELTTDNNQPTQDVFVRVSDRKTTDTFTGTNFKVKPDTITCTKLSTS